MGKVWLQGVVRNGQVVLAAPLELPDGAAVVVTDYELEDDPRPAEPKLKLNDEEFTELTLFLQRKKTAHSGLNSRHARRSTGRGYHTITPRGRPDRYAGTTRVPRSNLTETTLPEGKGMGEVWHEGADVAPNEIAERSETTDSAPAPVNASELEDRWPRAGMLSPAILAELAAFWRKEKSWEEVEKVIQQLQAQP